MLIGRVADWYRDDFGFSLPLEDQAEAAIEKYRLGKTSLSAAEFFADGVDGPDIESYLGLDNFSYDLRDLREDYFPSLLRRSALLKPKVPP
jgi:hypothetical protein